MSEYDLQFQADLEKAQELSLESLALEQFRRQKLAHNDSNVSGDINLSLRRRDDADGPPPALPPPPQRSSRGRPPSPTDDTDDLISFSSPTSKTAPKGPHEALIDQLNKLSASQEETPTNASPDTTTMSNNYYNNRPPGYQYSPQYAYPYQPPYQVPPYPTGSPYGMPSPIPAPSPVQNYVYYSPPPMVPPPTQTAPSTPMYSVPYQQTRMSSPYMYSPQYNYNTTNMISRPTRPVYPQANPRHSYPPPVPQVPNQSQSTNVINNNVKPIEPTRESPETISKPEYTRKVSEISNASNESSDTLGSLPDMNLIDFGKRNGGSSQGSVRVSVLEAFDPLLIEQNNADYTVGSEGSSSVYEEYDPLDFLYSETEMREAPVYATVNKKEKATLPSPPPKSIPAVPAVPKPNTTDKLYDCIVKVHTREFDNEHKAFLKMIIDVRSEFQYNNEKTNPGHVIAVRSDGKYPPNTSIKIMVHHEQSDEPIAFTSDVESTVEHVILTVVCSLVKEIRDDMSGYMLRVWGANEYLTPGSSLSEYDYVRECLRLEKDVRLSLHEGKDRSLARSERDDARDSHLTLEDIVPTQGAGPSLTFDNLSILLETLEGELSRAIGITSAEGVCSPNRVVQAVKAICALAGGVETLYITHTISAFCAACSGQNTSQTSKPEIVSDKGSYSGVVVRPATRREAVQQRAGRVRDSVRALLALYVRTARPDLALSAALAAPNPHNAAPAHTISETTLFCIEALHSLPPCWNYDEYVFHVQLYYGTRAIKVPRITHTATIEATGFYPRILFDTWMNLDDVPISTLPREARLVLTLYGRTQKPIDGQNQPVDNNGQNTQSNGDNNTFIQFEEKELGWTAIQLFDFDGLLANGNYVLPVWPTFVDKRIGPAPNLFDSPTESHPVVNIEIPLYTHTGVKWCTNEDDEKVISRKDLPKFDSLDGHTQSQLMHVIEQGVYNRMKPEEREKLWEKRQYLVELPGALPLVLAAATNWYGGHRSSLIALMKVWETPSPLNAMHLLMPCFPDSAVRSFAVRLISGMSDDELCRVLPQLCQALRHEQHEASPLARMLIARSLASPTVAHKLFWLLIHSLPNISQKSNEEYLGITLEDNQSGPCTPHSGSTWRYALLLRALLAVCGSRMATVLRRQGLLVKMLSDVAQSVKSAKDGVRQRALIAGVELIAAAVRADAISLPLGLARTVHDVDIKSCMYFNSNTLPLKINFIGSDNAVIPAMFKVGDDLRQDALVLQVMRVMDSLWLKARLDLRMVTFQAVPTNDRRGMIEIVSEAETLRAIQTEWGLTGSFKDKPIAEWLAKHNPSELEYQRARDNFTASCAGYSVATYLLGICDRHNDNIMLKTSGHLFHIDFGKFLGDAQMFGNFKRDRAPFVLTHDMVYVINGGDRPTQKFHHFVELCCMAFNIVRAHHDHILDLFALMALSGVPGVTYSAVDYVRSALLLGSTNAEAAAAFARLITSSLKSKFTPINFFLHNLAQMRASGDQGNSTSEILSFMSRTYTMSQEGRLDRVEVLGYEKRYDPEKHYVYVLRIYRQSQPAPTVLYRSYKHFTELYQKICLHFPLAKVHSLPSGLHVGRSNIRQVAERRFGDVQAFLTSLFSLAEEIAHSDLVYTFFHPLLRDQQDVEPQRLKNPTPEVQEGSWGAGGSLKLSVQYVGGLLAVLILHAQSLPTTPQGLPPNPYVKVYLVPDPTKETKRKTRVMKKNAHPSFMEMLEYRLSLDVVKTRVLRATVWHHDPLQENQFLGGVEIPLATLPLRNDTVGWYPLQYLPR